MPRAEVEQRLWLLERAFKGGLEHSLLSNLRDVRSRRVVDYARREGAHVGEALPV